MDFGSCRPPPRPKTPTVSTEGPEPRAPPAPSSKVVTSSRATTPCTYAVLSGLKKKRKKPTLSRGGRAPAGALHSPALPSLSGLTTAQRGRRGFPREGKVSQQGWARAPCRPLSVLSGGLLFLIGCFWDNGHLYRADQPSPAPGHRCLNWLDAQSGLAFAPESGECPSRAAGGRAGWRRPCPNPGPCCLLSPLRRRQPQLLPEPGPGPARALVLRQPRGWSS